MDGMLKTILTPDQVAEFHRCGFLVLRGVFDADTVRTVTSWVDDLQSWPETPGRHMMYFETSNTELESRVLNRMENFVPFHPGMAELLRSQQLLGACSELFGEPAVLYKEKINFKLPGGGGFEAHQDSQAGWETYAKDYITAMVTVDRTTVENGCLEMGHWNHRRELIGNLWEPLTDDQLKEVEFVPLETEPGDVVFFDAYVPHRSAPNLTQTPRRVLYLTYNKLADGDFRERYYADKRRSYPPDCEREAGREYAYKV
jgi:ectoine hydroxylase-related dioxygenase (phytanoyl-CoA dioxygenase family)